MQLGPDPSTGEELPAAGAAQPTTPSVTAAVRERAREAVVIKRMNDVLHRHVDPDRAFTRASATTQEEGTLTITHQWHEKRGVGLLYYSVADARTAPAKESWCGPGYSTKNLVRITCSTTRAPDGRPIVVGVAEKTVNSQGVPYAGSGGRFVRYVRPDGRVVVVALLRMNTIERVADSIPGGRPGVAAPSAILDNSWGRRLIRC